MVSEGHKPYLITEYVIIYKYVGKEMVYPWVSDAGIFPFNNNPKNIDPSYQKNLDQILLDESRFLEVFLLLKYLNPIALRKAKIVYKIILQSAIELDGSRFWNCSPL